MNSTDYFANQALWEGSRAHRLQQRVDDLEAALDEAEYEIRAWKQTCIEMVRERNRP